MLLTPPFQKSHPQEKGEISWTDVFLCFKKLFIACLVMASLSSPPAPLLLWDSNHTCIRHVHYAPLTLWWIFYFFSPRFHGSIFCLLIFSSLILCSAVSDLQGDSCTVIDFRYTVFYSSGISIWFFKYFISLMKILIFLMHLFCPWCLYFL